MTVFLSVFSNTFGEQLIQFSRCPNVLLMRFCSIIEVGPTPKPQPQVMCIMTPDKDCEEGLWERQYTEALQGKRIDHNGGLFTS